MLRLKPTSKQVLMEFVEIYVYNIYIDFRLVGP